MNERKFIEHVTVKDDFRLGKTVYMVSQIFMSKQTKQEVWLEIITRGESLKNGSQHANES